jgi:flavin reductase (DIM6/NTAB) family NADH-FMN oxidoreductase RutF
MLTPREFWKALRMRATGAAIVTTWDQSEPSGFVALSATHFSADPPLMTISVSSTTSALAPLLRSSIFAINYLAEEGLPIWERFSARDAPKGSERFAGIEWHPGTTGAPILDGVTGALECRVEETLERHETFLVFGRIVGVFHATGRFPLVHFDSKTLPPRPLGCATSATG